MLHERSLTDGTDLARGGFRDARNQKVSSVPAESDLLC
ncbi:hypothetical protein GLE_0382 [Lysobacter enzymogenes]|uniref:Uncharacterized protein n=1 Tax=Lysobacter enzymogenes TaxID=69 RepID=A0A0S2DB21_LYSEN|nr:hypothetical protein GLE_0382 [Lysobacter enzymogenes]